MAQTKKRQNDTPKKGNMAHQTRQNSTPERPVEKTNIVAHQNDLQKGITRVNDLQKGHPRMTCKKGTPEWPASKRPNI